MSIFPNTKLTNIQNVNDVFFINFCATAGWTGTIATLPGGAVLTFLTTVGNPNTMVPQNTAQLGKQRLYNTTRGTYALILNCAVGPVTITLTANVPAGWALGDVITTITPNMPGKPYNYVDIELTTGDGVGNDLIFCNLYGYDAGGLGQSYLIHPFNTAWAASKESGIFTQAAAATFISGLVIVPLNQNVFSLYWTASGAATARPILRQVAT